MNLRPYQDKAVQSVEGHFAFGDGELMLELPTGAGKSVIIAEVTKESNGKVLVMANVTKIIYQLSDLFDELGIGHTLLKANAKKEPKIKSDKVMIAMQQTLHRRENIDFNPDTVIIDERHISFGSMSMTKILDRMNPSRIVGLSATPYDAEGKSFKDAEVSRPVTIRELTEQGYLSPVDTFVSKFSENLDFSDVDINTGDYSEVQLADIINTDEYNEQVVLQWKQITGGTKKTIVFASGIDHCESIKDKFREHGVKCETTHSKKHSKEQESVMSRFVENDFLVLVSVSQLTTGFDMSDIEVGVMCRPTKVRSLWMQCIGRLTRVHDGIDKKMFLDFGQCTQEFGLYDEIYNPPEYDAEKDEIKRIKESHRLDGASIIMQDDNSDYTIIDRKNIEARLVKVKKMLDEKVDIHVAIRIFDASRSLGDVLKYGAMIYNEVVSEVNQNTIDWIQAEWMRFLAKSKRSQQMNIKALKTRTKNIIKGKKKFASLYYFANFLYENEDESYY